jgi:hypothetical protein
MPAAGGSKLRSLKRRKLIEGDPQSRVDERVFEWHEPKNLA